MFNAAKYCCILYDKSKVWETNPLNVLYILLQILVLCEHVVTKQVLCHAVNSDLNGNILAITYYSLLR